MAWTEITTTAYTYYGVPALLLSLPPLVLYLSKYTNSSKQWKSWTLPLHLLPPDRRAQLTDLSLLFPLLLPTEPTARKKLIKNYYILGLTTTTKRLLKVAHPILLRRIIHLLSSSGSSGQNQLPWVEIISFVLLRRLATTATDALHSSANRKARSAMTDRVELVLYQKLLSLTSEFHETKQTGTLWKTVCSAGGLTVNFFSLLVFTQIPYVVDMVLGVATCWSVFGSGIALSMLLLAVFYAVLSLQVVGDHDRRSYERAIQGSENSDNLSHDAISNWQTVAYFDRFIFERQRYENAVATKRAMIDTWRDNTVWKKRLKDGLAAVGMAAVCLYGGYKIQAGKRTTGDFVLLFQFLTELFYPLDILLMIPESVDRFLSDSKKFLEILKLEPGIKDKEGAKEFQLKEGEIEFEGVGFRYPGQEEDAVKNVSFTVPGGKMVAIVGETGGGKSTLFKLLCRAYDVRTGSIKIDGQDLRDVKLGSLREHISVVPQNIGVFNASVMDNLRYANPEATKEQIEEACEAAALHKRILGFPNGYDEKVGEKGVKLSGGELQRLAIARALLRPAQIVLFDEATSNLDAETEARIQEYLRKWYVGRTVVVVAHRLATIANADLILSFKNGQIVEAGRAEELLAKKGYFHLLWEKQRLAWDPASKTSSVGNELEKV
ncbi:heavy metal tolerance protein [Podospora australis]|uniref:Heavy metal tolerance protein n=1 Tax=Podospora australis TaxID=1536484 RepID=A0AAN7AI48_9PEZI|nr:heavy metal tolerance protein [Podospora australis]